MLWGLTLDNSSKTANVSKIAILNPYLLGGHFETAEIESAKRFADAAKQFGIEVKVLSNSSEIECFDPDFVITITYQIPKLTPYPTYGLLTMPCSWVKNEPRFVRNILSYDGFLTTSLSTIKWLKQLCSKHNKIMNYANAAFSLQQIPYRQGQFKQAKAVYIGTNWDKNRHHDLFSYLDKGEYLQCYGPTKSWSMYSSSLYGGEIPFDGISTLAVYHQHGAGLCVNHPDFDSEGIPSSRTFEIAASSAIPICALNTYTQSIFGDAVIYVNQTESTEVLSEQITEAIKWIRFHHQEAAEMAKAVNEIFNKKVSYEIFIPEILNMHESVLKQNNVKKNISTNTFHLMHTETIRDNVTYFIVLTKYDYDIQKIINSILAQSYPNIEICIIGDIQTKDLKFENVNAMSIKYLVKENNDIGYTIQKHLNENDIQWFGLINNNGHLFNNHVQINLHTYYQLPEINREKLKVITSGCLSLSNKAILDDDIHDEKMIPSDNKGKVAYLPFDGGPPYNEIPIQACLFKSDAFNDILLDIIEDKIPEKITLPTKVQNEHWINFACITSFNEI